jgi:hypothetical protein
MQSKLIVPVAAVAEVVAVSAINGKPDKPLTESNTSAMIYSNA